MKKVNELFLEATKVIHDIVCQQKIY